MIFFLEPHKEAYQLGSSLFICYINDLPEVIHTNVKIIADDIKLFTDASIHRNDLQLQHDIGRLREWTSKWQLSLNASKCKVMHIGTRNPEHQYHMTQNHQMSLLEKTEVEKDLVVYIDNQLKFSTMLSYKSTMRTGSQAQYVVRFHTLTRRACVNCTLPQYVRTWNMVMLLHTLATRRTKSYQNKCKEEQRS